MATAGTSVPGISWGLTGPIAPSTQAILTGVQQDYSQAFNVSLNFGLTTPQGQLTSSEAAIIANTNALIVYQATQFDPSYAQGRMQDALGRIYFMSRKGAQPTTIQVACNGSLATIPAGPANFGLVQDQAGNIYQCTEAGTLPANGGTITLSFAAVVPGPIAVPGSVRIYQAISGWDTATVVSGVEGTSTETSQQFERRRAASVAANSTNKNDALQGALLALPGVLGAYVIDNPTNAPATIGGVTLPANALYVAVTGGAATAIAQTIWTKKPPGIPLYSGNNSQTVEDTNPGYSPPYPSYTITWETPAALPILFAVVIANSPQVPSTATASIQAAIIQAFTGGVASFTGSISGNTLTVSAISQGAIGVGQLINGVGVSPGTIVTETLTGSGGIGTYLVGVAQTVPSVAMISGPATNTPPFPPPASIGATIYANQYAGPIGALGAWASVRSIQVGSNNSPGAVFDGWIAGSVLTVTTVDLGTIAVGQTLAGFDSTSSIGVGTTIISEGSGTGGTGTYNISTSQTVAGATFTGTRSAANQITATDVSGTIGIGDVIAGTGIPSGTTITGQLSGTTGGAGTYSTSADTTASAASVLCAVSITAAVADSNLVGVNIDQQPTIVAANIAVTFV